MKKHNSEKRNTVCAVICEYNPFHNGHKKQLEEMREKSGCDLLLCLMSGNFVQRGESAILDKHTRAIHAVRGGADGVLELPLPFSVGNAETFATGAVKLLSAIPAVKKLAFGCECAASVGDAERGCTTTENILAAARISLEEPPAFKKILHAGLDEGLSFAKARFLALKSVMPQADEGLFSSPNNMLAVEYAKAVLRLGAPIELLPLKRTGADDGDERLHENFSSASAIRKAVLQGGMPEKTEANVPDFVWRDLREKADGGSAARLDGMEYYALASSSPEGLAACPDCTEGLENRLLSLAEEHVAAADIVQAATSRRYTAARIRRILLARTLGFSTQDVKDFLQTPLYLNALAVDEEKSDAFLRTVAESALPLLTRRKDAEDLTGAARACFALNERADRIYRAVSRKQPDLYGTRFVKK